MGYENGWKLQGSVVMKEANTLLQTNGNEIQLEAGEIYCGPIDDC